MFLKKISSRKAELLGRMRNIKFNSKGPIALRQKRAGVNANCSPLNFLRTKKLLKLAWHFEVTAHWFDLFNLTLLA